MKGSIYLTLKDAETVIPAAGFADQTGLPLNTFLTIDWEMAEVPGRWTEIQTEYFKLMRDWYRYNLQLPVTCVWVLENSSGKGVHGHYLIHVPNGWRNAFKGELPDWLKKIGGDYVNTKQEKTIHSRLVPYRDGVTRLNPVKGVLKYMLKGIDPSIEGVDAKVRRPKRTHDVGPLGIDYKSQGYINTKRCGTSQNIGLAARLNNPNPRKDVEKTPFPESHAA
jgi:hypothetical protein